MKATDQGRGSTYEKGRDEHANKSYRKEATNDATGNTVVKEPVRGGRDGAGGAL